MEAILCSFLFLEDNDDKRSRKNSGGIFTLMKVFLRNVAHYLPEIASNSGITGRWFVQGCL